MAEARYTKDPRRQRWVRQMLTDWRSEAAGKTTLEGRARALLNHMIAAAGMFADADDDTRNALIDVLEDGEVGPLRFVAGLVGKVGCSSCFHATPLETVTADYRCPACVEQGKQPVKLWVCSP